MGPDDVQTDGGTTTNTTETQQEARTVPVTALQAERDKRQALEKRIAEIEAAQQAEAQKRAEEQGEYKRLYEEAKTKADELAGKVGSYEQREAARVEALTARNLERVEALPENLRDIVPPGLDADTLAGWLDKAIPALTATGAQYAAGTRGAGGAAPSKPPIPPKCLNHPHRPPGMADDKWYAIWSKTQEGRAFLSNSEK